METVQIFGGSPVYAALNATLDEIWMAWIRNDCKYPVLGYDDWRDYMQDKTGTSWHNQIPQIRSGMRIEIADPAKWCWFLLKHS